MRVYRLGDKNIWWDEGWTVWLAEHDFAWIALRTASDEHPPLHYWLMNLWQNVFGADVLTGRFFSLLFGVLLVALVFRIGKDMGGVRLGLLAALFLTLARFEVWWSQDIKNYTLSAFFAWASVWMVWRIIFSESVSRRDLDSEKIIWAGYIFATALALYSHYLAALIVLANNVFVAVVWLVNLRAQGWSQTRGFAARWIAAQVAVIVLFAPWLYLYLQNGATWSAAPAFDFGLFLRLAATVLTLGVTTFIENYTLVVLGLVVVAGLSVGWVVRAVQAARTITQSRPTTTRKLANPTLNKVNSLGWAALFLLLITLIPPALIYVLALTPAAIFAPKVQARYLMMLTPAVAMLFGLGVLFAADLLRGRAGRAVPAALVVLIAAAQVWTLNDYFRERYLRDEYFSLAQMINNFGLDGDAVVLNTDQEYPTFLYYLKRPFDWIGVPNGVMVNETTAQRVAATARQSNAVWVVTIPDALQQDPMRLVEQKIAERLPKQYEQTFGDKRLVLYTNTLRNVKDVPRASFSPQLPRDIVFDERLKLVGIDLPVREALAGDVVRVVTYWEAQDLTTVNLALQTRSGEIVSRAGIPISIGARARAQGDLQIPPGTALDELQVIAQARLKALPIGTVRVLPRDGLDLNPTDAVMQPRDERFGANIRLVGVNVPNQKFASGANVPVTLFWQTDSPLPTSYTVFVHLRGALYNPAQNNLLWGQVDRLPLDGKLPTTAWTPDQTIADPYQVKLDENAPNGLYKIEIGLYDSNGTRLRVFDSNGNEIGDAFIVGEVEVGG